jgi:hypothetical protein
VVTEAGDEVEPSSERFDVTGYRVDGGQLAPLDLGTRPGVTLMAWASWA